MKKSIRQPENWQDFESLCKKLFGELWGCPLKIKKNGRLGQPQAGVDVYTIPSGKVKYWGIQCKGKNNYKKTKLTKKEIDAEIEKAKNFKPELGVFIFCTTALKDSKIEEYIRLKDIESLKNSGFEVLLYSWEDIADLIEENRNTYHWYVDNIQFKDQFEIQIYFFGVDNKLIVKPKFEKIKTQFKIKEQIETDLNRFNFPLQSIFAQIKPISIFGSNKVNHSWCSFETLITNTGSSVLEDWKFYLYFDENVRKIDDDFTYDIFLYEKVAKYRTTWAYEEDNMILYSPLNDKPLIQKDSRQFKSFFIPKVGRNKVTIRWKLLARDYNREGEVTFEVKPEYVKRHKTIWVDSKSEEKEEIEIVEFIETKKSG
ncbi:MAG: hypothetical protein H8E11_01115 [Candidatus Cloacimonetes bacterium]|nr:hypothetical protein [Candidatus Cloacimonadota bacterium]